MSLDSRLKLRHILCFLEIARAGQLTDAADRLGVTQPAVSKTLRELEDILGAPLFDRTGRSLRLNGAGQAFQSLAGSGILELTRAQRAVRAAPGEVQRITVGTLPTAATELVPRAALAFRAAHPACILRATTGPNWLLFSQLREGALDLVVGRMADSAQMKGLTFEQLYTEDVVAAVRADHPLTAPLSQEPLMTYPLILPPPGAVIGPLVRNYLHSLGAGIVMPLVETVSQAIGRQLLLTSDAIWFISRGVIAQDLEAGILRVLPGEAAMLAGPVGISLRQDAAPLPEVTAFVTCLRAARG